MSRDRTSTVRGGYTTAMPASKYEQRATKPKRNRPLVTASKVKTTKPRAHQVGRTKR